MMEKMLKNKIKVKRLKILEKKVKEKVKERKKKKSH